MKNTDVSAGGILLFSLIYFFGGLDSLAAIIIAASVHELGHVALIVIFGGTVHKIKLSLSGMCMKYSGVNSTAGQVLSLLAGSAFGLILAYAASYFGNINQNTLLIKISGFSLILSLYNLLPVLPLDGGRALKCLLEGTIGIRMSEIILYVSGLATGAALLLYGSFMIRTQHGLALLTAGAWILIAQTGIVKNLSVM